MGHSGKSRIEHILLQSTLRCSCAASLHFRIKVFMHLLYIHLHSSGGGVVDHLLADVRKKYHVRGITRDVSSPKAKKLADRGIEVVQGDLGHKESLVKVRPASLLPARSVQCPCLQDDGAALPLLRHPCACCNAGISRRGSSLYCDRLCLCHVSGKGIPTGKKRHLTRRRRYNPVSPQGPEVVKTLLCRLSTGPERLQSPHGAILAVQIIRSKLALAQLLPACR